MKRKPKKVGPQRCLIIATGRVLRGINAIRHINNNPRSRARGIWVT